MHAISIQSGDTTTVPDPQPYTTTRRVPVDISSPCDLWAGDTNDQRYGRLMVSGQMLYAHRVAYQLHVGPITRGWEIDHLCHNVAFDAGTCHAGPCDHRRCFNPLHLDLVPPGINSARGGHPLYVSRRLSVCRKGHDLTDPANVLVRKNGHRRCRVCDRASEKRRRANRKAVSQ